MEEDACITVRTGLERSRGQGPKVDVLSELGGTSECEPRGSSRGKKDPTFLQHVLCVGLMVGAAHNPPVEISQQPCEVEMGKSFLKNTETMAEKESARARLQTQA